MTALERALDLARQDAGLTPQELWIRYFALGGMAPALELEAVCHGAMVTTDPDHDVIAHALNERFTELGRNHPVPYSEDSGPMTRPPEFSTRPCPPSSCDVRAAHDGADHQALTESAAGSSEAFMRLVDRHAGACLAVARQVLRHEDLARDAVQEAYLDLWRHASSVDPGRSPLGPWLVMLTHRRAVDRVRVEQRRPRPTDRIPDLAGDFDVEEHVTTAILGQQTVALLRRLPAEQRECLVLAYWGGYTMTGIAKRLDIPVGTVKSRCRLALRALRLLLNEQGLDVHNDGVRP